MALKIRSITAWWVNADVQICVVHGVTTSQSLRFQRAKANFEFSLFYKKPCSNYPVLYRYSYQQCVNSENWEHYTHCHCLAIGLPSHVHWLTSLYPSFIQASTVSHCILCYVNNAIKYWSIYCNILVSLLEHVSYDWCGIKVISKLGLII